MREHRINPVLYVEYESINGADKTLKEVVGFDSKDDESGSNAEARREHKREIEGKLIFSSDFKGWNLSENFIAEKNLQQGTWEFGYAIGFGRPRCGVGFNEFFLENKPLYISAQSAKKAQLDHASPVDRSPQEH